MTPSSLLNHLWQSTLFAAAAAVLTLAFRKNRAPVRYWLWFAASVKFLVPFSLLATIGSHFEWRTAPTIVQPQFFSVVEEISQPVAPPAPLPRSEKEPLASSRGPAVLWGVWLSGLGVVTFAWARQWRRVRTALRLASPLHLDLPITAVSSPVRLEPGVFGVFRPVLLLPESISQRLTPSQFDAIVAHELCHVRRRDNLTAAIHMAVEAIFWFHPLAWWIGKRLVDERERACDEAVLLAAGEPQDYAEAILNVCKLYVESPLVCVSGVTGSNLKTRIRKIMTEGVADDLNVAAKLILAVAGVAALATPIAVGIMNAPSLQAQSAPAPTWEVASIRPCASNNPPGRISGEGPTPGNLRVTCDTTTMLIQEAYEFFANGRMNIASYFGPVEGGPSWINSDRYSINAKPEGTPRYEMMHGPMLQTLLEDRFKLKIHRETRQIPVYELTVAKGGPKLQPHKEGSCTPVDFTKPSVPVPGQAPFSTCRMGWLRVKGPNLTFDPLGVSVTDFSQQLHLDRPVVDKTGFVGLFDIHLEFALDQTTSGFIPANHPEAVLPDDPTGGTSIFTAVQEQLGLKLAPAKGPGEFIVIDRVERPSEN